jgi:glycosyltransferase involved in cell wall biosynthesis
MTAAPTIFVLIASYRDKECQWTVKDIFDKAANPDQIRVGICWQADSEQDKECFEIETRPAQVDAVFFRPEDSLGLGWARAQAQALLRDEDYALQIDSHMRFVPDWDKRMIALLDQCDSKAPILTVYPPAYTPPDQLEVNPPARVQCVGRFSSAGILFYEARIPPAGVQPTTPIETACLAGGFIFGASDWLRAIAHDPYIYFTGEEHALAARLWTHGFDLYSPQETVIYHYYLRAESAKHWSDDPTWSDKHQRSLLRLRQLLTPANLPARDRVDLGIYGLGSKRSLIDYEAYAGVSFAAHSIATFAQSYPYVRSADLATALRTDHQLEVSGDTELFIVDEQGLLFCAARGEIYHLNTAATFVWCKLEDGADWDNVVSGLCDFCDMSAAEAEDALVNLVVHWRGQGVLKSDPSSADESPLSPSRDDAPTAAAENSVAFPEPDKIYHERHYRVLERSFCIQFSEPEQLEWIAPTLTHFEQDKGQSADHLITIVADGGEHHIFVGERLTFVGRRISELAPLIKYQLVRNALDHYDHILNLHAGVVAKGGAVFAFPANSGAGKSTLVAGLIKRGYQYFSDEIVPLARDTCLATPIPLGICIKDTAFPTLQVLYPEILHQPLHNREDGRRAIYLPPPKDSIASYKNPLAISHIVFPHYEPGAATSLTPVTRVEAFARVLEQCVSIPKPLTLADASALVNWIEQVQCYDMISGSLDAAMDQIDGLLGAANSG